MNGSENRLLANEENGNLYFYHLDRIGSPIMITNASGTVVKEKKYEAFGNLVSSSGTYDDNREFTGKEKDPTGFHYFISRQYNADLGRFMSPDLINLYPALLDLGHPQTLNPYVYCHNDPINYLDPLGLQEGQTGHWEWDKEKGMGWVIDEPLVVTGTRDNFDAYSWWSDYQFFNRGYSEGSMVREAWRAQLPDFVNLTVSVGSLLGISFHFVLDRYGNLYFGTGPTLAKSLTLLSGSLSVGSISKVSRIFRMPTETELSKFLTGHSIEPGGGSLVGFQGDYVPESGWGIEAGLYSPQVGVTYHYSGKIYKCTEIKW